MLYTKFLYRRRNNFYQELIVVIIITLDFVFDLNLQWNHNLHVTKQNPINNNKKGQAGKYQMGDWRFKTIMIVK